MERVLREVWQETKNPLLVYATEDALETPRAPLSAPLERFVRAENKAFRQELSRASNDAAEGRLLGLMEVTSPSKRKHRADSADSMDSNRASIGSDDRFEDPFEDTTQAATNPEQRRVAAQGEESDEPGPPLPARRPMLAETPDPVAESKTERGEPGSVSKATAEDRDDGWSRGPEMQERTRPPSFMAVPQDNAAHESGIDMELGEYQG